MQYVILDVHGYRREKKCSCRVTSVALICLPSHICGSLRSIACAAVSTPEFALALLPFSFSKPLSSCSSFALFLLSVCLPVTLKVHFHLIWYPIWFTQCRKCKLSVLLNRAHTIACSNLYCFFLIISGQPPRSKNMASPEDRDKLFQANLFVRSLKQRLWRTWQAKVLIFNYFQYESSVI